MSPQASTPPTTRHRHLARHAHDAGAADRPWRRTRDETHQPTIECRPKDSSTADFDEDAGILDHETCPQRQTCEPDSDSSLGGHCSPLISSDHRALFGYISGADICSQAAEENQTLACDCDQFNLETETGTIVCSYDTSEELGCYDLTYTFADDGSYRLVWSVDVDEKEFSYKIDYNGYTSCPSLDGTPCSCGYVICDDGYNSNEFYCGDGIVGNFCSQQPFSDLDGTCSASSHPSESPTMMPSTMPVATMAPSARGSWLPETTTQQPTDSPSFMPSESEFEEQVSSETPTQSEIDISSNFPTSRPTIRPSNAPSFAPSTSYPSQEPTISPSTIPSVAPSTSPSHSPTLLPSDAPSEIATDVPSIEPSAHPTLTPSDHPSSSPSLRPSFSPSEYPSSSFPSFLPSGSPIASDTPSTWPTSNQPTDIVTGLASERVQTSMPTGVVGNLASGTIAMGDNSSFGSLIGAVVLILWTL